MALVIEAIDANGVVTRTPVEGTGQFVMPAVPGFRYRVVDDTGQPIGAGPRVIQLDGDLVVDNLPGGESIVLDNFFTSCTSDAPCAFSLEEIGGNLDQSITPASEPVAALTEGGFLMNTTGSAATLPQEPGTELNWKPIAAGAGGLLVVAGAAGGGGGGESGTDTTPPANPTLTTANVGSGTPIIRGTGETGSTVFVEINIAGTGNTVGYRVDPDASGEWTLDMATVTPFSGTLPAGGLPAGVASPVTLQAVDSANNLSGVVAGTITYDNTPPAASVAIVSADDDLAPVTGPLANGDTTNDTTPTISGTLSAALAAGESVEVLRDGTAVGSATVSGLTWTFTDAALTAASYVYTARAIDQAGNATAASAGFTINIDSTAPAAVAVITEISDNLAPDIGTIANGGLTNDGSPTLAGTLSAPLAADESLQVLRDGAVVGQAVVTGSSWQYQEPALADGTYSYVARTIDAAGNPGTASAAYSITIDSTNPDASATITNAEDNVAPLIGSLSNADSTNDNAPLLNGSLNEALAANEVIEILRDGTVIGTAVVDPLNNTLWRFQDTGLTDGTYVYTARTVDAAGNAASPSGTFQLVVDTTAPAVVATINTATDNIGTITSPLTAGDSTDDTQPRLNGALSQALASGETLEILRDGTVVSTQTPAGLAWNYTVTPALAEGTYVFTAQVTDTAGNASAVSADFGLTIDTSAPTQAVVISQALDNVGASTGTLVSGDTTDDTVPVFSGTVAAGLAAGDSVQVLLDGAVLGNANRTGNTWTFSDPTALADGSYQYTARVIDAAGNVGPASAGFDLTVDTAGPTTTTVITGAVDSVAPLTAPLASGDTTNDTIPVLQGTISSPLGAGESVEVLRDGVIVGNAAVGGGATTWTYTPAAALSDGTTYQYTARVTDGTGNAGTNSAAFNLTIDATDPAATLAITNTQADIADTTPIITGSITGTLAAGEVIEVLRDGVLVGQATPAGATWSFTEPAAIPDASYAYTARVVDAAGNIGTVSAGFNLTVDTVDPTATLAITNTQADIADTTPTITGSITGTLAAGEVIEVLRDGVLVGQATPAGATWSFTEPAAIPDASYAYTARVVDAAGNIGTVSAGFNLTIDTVDPAATADITDVTDDVPLTVGSVADNGLTNDAAPEIVITLDALLAAGEVIEVSRDGALIGNATGSGLAYSFGDAGLTVNTYVYTAMVVDAAGNTGPAGSDYTIVVDPGNPTAVSSNGASELTLNDLLNEGNSPDVDTPGGSPTAITSTATNTAVGALAGTDLFGFDQPVGTI